MILVELALQGLGGFSPVVRVAFRPGLNVFCCPDGRQRCGIVDALYHTIYADPSRSAATVGLAAPGASACRMGVTFLGRDKLTYRLVREAANGAVSLHRFDPAQKKYDALARGSQEAAQYVRVQEQLPDEVSYERLFTLTPETAPSLGKRARMRSGSGVASGMLGAEMSGIGASGLGRSGMARAKPRIVSSLGSLPGATEVEARPSRKSLSDLRSLLDRLKNDLDAVRRAETAQEDLDRWSAERVVLGAKVAAHRALEETAADLRGRIAALRGEGLSALPEGFPERIRRAEAARGKHEAEMAKLRQERGEIDQSQQDAGVVELHRDPYFVAGISTALLFVVLAVVLSRPSIALLNVLSMMVAAGAAFRYVGDLERTARFEARRTALDEREARLHRQVELETSAVTKLTLKLGLGDARLVLAAFDEISVLEEELRRADVALEDAVRCDPGTLTAAEALAGIEKHIQDSEALLVASQGVSDSAEGLERAIRLTEERISRLDSAQGTDSTDGVAVRDEDDEDGSDGYGAGYGRGGGGGGGGSSAGSGEDAGAMFAIGYGGMGGGGGPPQKRGSGSPFGGFGGFGGVGDAGAGERMDGGAEGIGDRSSDLMQAAVDILQMPVDELGSSLATRIDRLISIFSQGEFEHAEFGSRGEMAVCQKSDGTAVPYFELEGVRLDRVDAALRLALIHACVERHPIPVLIDDPFATFDGEPRALLNQMAHSIAKATQVLIFTERDDLGGSVLSL